MDEQQRRLNIPSEWMNRLFLSLMAAIVLWGYVTLTRNPETDRQFTNIPIAIDSLADDLVMVTDIGTAVIEVTGPRSVINGLVVTDVKAHMGLDEIDEPGTYTVRVRVSKPDDVWFASSNPRTMSVVIDREQTKGFSLTPVQTGELGSNQQVESIVPSVSEVTVTGPSAIVQRIARVDLPVDIADRTNDFATAFSPVAVDESGQILVGVEISPDPISAAVKITTRGKEVAVITQLSGSPASGFEIVDRVVVPNTVLVDGPEDILADLITVNTEIVDITGATENINRSVQIQDLPEGVRLLNPANGQVQVVVQVRQRGVQQPLPSQEVTVINLGQDLVATALPNSVLVTVVGNEQDIEELSPANLVVQIDVKGLGPGTYNLPPTIIVPQNMEWSSINPTTITVTIERVGSPGAASSPVASPQTSPEAN